MKLTYLAPLALVFSLAACGGGGGGTSPTPVGVPSTAPASTAPQPSPSPSSAAAQAAGHVVDYTSGAPLSGATVIVGPVLVYGATPPPTLPAGDVKATTAADGSFSIGAVTPANIPCVLPNSAAPTTSNGVVSTCTANVMVYTADHITLHAPIVLGTGANSVGTLKVSTASANDTAWLAAINSDRAANGGAAPVVFDERLVEAARAWDAYNTSVAYFYGDSNASAAPPYSSSITVYGSLGGYDVTVSQNSTGGSSTNPSGPYAESEFATEGPAGPHFSTIINPAMKWTGVAEDAGQGPAGSLTPPSGEEYIEDMMTPPSGGV